MCSRHLRILSNTLTLLPYAAVAVAADVDEDEEDDDVVVVLQRKQRGVQIDHYSSQQDDVTIDDWFVLIVLCDVVTQKSMARTVSSSVMQYSLLFLRLLLVV